MNKWFQNIDRAKEILADPEQYHRDITDVAMDSGFYEMKKFNVEFRKATDMAPLEYRAFHTQFRLVTGMSPEKYLQAQKKSA